MNEIVHDLRYERTRVTPLGLASASASVDEVHGRDAFRAMFQHVLSRRTSTMRARAMRPTSNCTSRSMKKLDADWGYELGVYYRLINHLFTFIDMAELPLEQRTRLANFARALLSSYELSMLFYNGLWGEGERASSRSRRSTVCSSTCAPSTCSHARDLRPARVYSATAFAGFDRRVEIWKGVEPVLDGE